MFQRFRHFRVVTGVELDSLGSFRKSLVVAIFQIQELRERPVRFKPVGRPGNRVPQAVFDTGRVVRRSK